MSRAPLPGPRGCQIGLPPRRGEDGLGPELLIAAACSRQRGSCPWGPSCPHTPAAGRCPAALRTAQPILSARRRAAAPGSVQYGPSYPVPSRRGSPPPGRSGGGRRWWRCRGRPLAASAALRRPAPAAFRNGAGGSGAGGGSGRNGERDPGVGSYAAPEPGRGAVGGLRSRDPRVKTRGCWGTLEHRDTRL